MTACERLKAIEASLIYAPVPPQDVLWLVSQVRTWQQFAKRVVDFGDALRSAPGLDSRITNGYEQLFHGN